MPSSTACRSSPYFMREYSLIFSASSLFPPLHHAGPTFSTNGREVCPPIKSRVCAFRLSILIRSLRLKTGSNCFSRLGILRTNAKREYGTYVPKHRVADLLGKLGNELMRDDKVQTIFARLGKDRRNGIGGKILELVDIKIKIAPCRTLRDIRARERRHEYFPRNNETEELRVQVADTTL